MSSVLSEYPETLPAPMVGVVTPTERRKVGSIGGVQSFRTVQRDRHGTRTYAFTFTKEQAAIFREWWVEWEQRGGGWFAANWPLPWSRGPNVFRFKNPPEWSLIGGGVDGQGYWRVSGSVEIRGRGMLPTVEVLYLTSTPYPVESIDELSIRAGGISPHPGYGIGFESLGLGAKITDGRASNGFVTYTRYLPEAIGISGLVVSAQVSQTIYSSYTYVVENVFLLGNIVSANAQVILVSYKNYKVEAVSLNGKLLSGIATQG